MFAGAMAAAPRAEAVLPVPPSNSLAFRLMRHDTEIGRHVLTFLRRGNALTVNIAVDARVTLLSIPLVQYSHRATEIWQGDTLTSVTGETDKNGRHQWVNARRSGEGLVVLGSQTQRYIAPEPAGCTSYWDRRVIDRPMISMEDGVLLRPSVSVHKAETIQLASGEAIPADRCNLSGAFEVDLWYDRTNTWASLAYTAADGSTVQYKRL
jgi:hypothetical protein